PSHARIAPLLHEQQVLLLDQGRAYLRTHGQQGQECLHHQNAAGIVNKLQQKSRNSSSSSSSSSRSLACQPKYVSRNSARLRVSPTARRPSPRAISTKVSRESACYYIKRK
ncbi:unnamed protein product, partial [Ectocarpus sp. 8 AP-2014]